ncbi:MAG: hypothetical protein HY675_06875 [Chloroflexi bacterium]|nr:hypothetical protein [Chloroflexota bacterium]
MGWLEDQKVILDFMLAEARGEIDWMSNAEMARFVEELVAETRERA